MSSTNLVHAVAQVDPSFDMSAEPRMFGPFTIEGLPDPQDPRRKIAKKFIIREIYEKSHSRHQAQSLKGMEAVRDEQGHVKLSMSGTGASASDAAYTASCLFEVEVVYNGDTVEIVKETPTTPSFIESLPHRIAKRLHVKAREISGANEDEETTETLTSRIDQDLKTLARIAPAEAEELRNKIEDDRKKLKRVEVGGTPGN